MPIFAAHYNLSSGKLGVNALITKGHSGSVDSAVATARRSSVRVLAEPKGLSLYNTIKDKR